MAPSAFLKCGIALSLAAEVKDIVGVVALARCCKEIGKLYVRPGGIVVIEPRPSIPPKQAPFGTNLGSGFTFKSAEVSESKTIELDRPIFCRRVLTCCWTGLLGPSIYRISQIANTCIAQV
jgi:hypothetical protein